LSVDRTGFLVITGVVLVGGAGLSSRAGAARAATAPRSTDSTKPPLNVRVTGVAGNTITLAWDSPVNNDWWWFYLPDNGDEECAIGTGSAGTPTGTAHSFTVIYGEFIGPGGSARLSATSAPVRITLPANADATPPTAPRNARREVQADGCSFLTEWDPQSFQVDHARR
jgi:hypothetical protein